MTRYLSGGSSLRKPAFPGESRELRVDTIPVVCYYYKQTSIGLGKRVETTPLRGPGGDVCGPVLSVPYFERLTDVVLANHWCQPDRRVHST